MCRLRESSRVDSRDSKEECRWRGGKKQQQLHYVSEVSVFPPTLVIVFKDNPVKRICVHFFDKERITFISPGNPHKRVQIPLVNCVSVQTEVQINRAGRASTAFLRDNPVPI